MSRPLPLLPTSQPDDAPEAWRESLARGLADIEAGRTVSIDTAIERLRQRVARMKAAPTGTTKP
jgi:predicted transcriptional regulator